MRRYRHEGIAAPVEVSLFGNVPDEKTHHVVPGDRRDRECGHREVTPIGFRHGQLDRGGLGRSADQRHQLLHRLFRLVEVLGMLADHLEEVFANDRLGRHRPVVLSCAVEVEDRPVRVEHRDALCHAGLDGR